MPFMVHRKLYKTDITNDRYMSADIVGRQKSADEKSAVFYVTRSIFVPLTIASTKRLIRLKIKSWQHFIADVVAKEKKENTIIAIMYITHIVENVWC